MATQQRSAGPDMDAVVWLVKSGDRVLGPFSGEEIKEKLFEKELVVIDEVTTPMKRWRYLRDEPAFAVVVEEIRKSQLGSREDTELGTFSAGTVTDTATLTDPTDRIEPLPSQTSVGQSDADAVQEADVVEETQTRQQQWAPPNQSVKQYGSGRDHKIQGELKRTARMLWLATTVIVSGAAFMFFRLQTPKPAETSGPDIGKILVQADEASRMGLFKDALAGYRRVYDSGFRDPSFLIDYATLALRDKASEGTAGQYVERTIMSEVNPASPDEWKRFFTLKGLTALMRAYDGEYQQIKTARAFFKDAIESGHDYLPARFNMLMADYLLTTLSDDKLGSVSESRPGASPLITAFQDVAEAAYESGTPGDRGIWAAAQMMKALLMLKQPALASQVDKLVSDFKASSKAVQFYQEATLFQAYAAYLQFDSRARPAKRLEKAHGLFGKLRLMLAVDPFVTDEYYMDPMVLTTPLNWSSLRDLCAGMLRNVKDAFQSYADAETILPAAGLFCRFKGGEDPAELSRELITLQTQHPNEKILRVLQAYFQFSRQPEQSKALLADLGQASDEDMLGWILRGRLCAITDYHCQDEYYRKSGASTPVSVYLLVGSIHYHLSQNDLTTAKARASLLAGAGYSESRADALNYVPFLRLKKEYGDRLGVK